jgi:hypothetical protein
VKRFSRAANCCAEILLRVLRCLRARTWDGAGLDELASESVAMYDVPLAVYSELSDEERSTSVNVLRRVAGIAKSEDKMSSYLYQTPITCLYSPFAEMTSQPKFPPAMQSVALIK